MAFVGIVTLFVTIETFDILFPVLVIGFTLALALGLVGSVLLLVLAGLGRLFCLRGSIRTLAAGIASFRIWIPGIWIPGIRIRSTILLFLEGRALQLGG